jgi:glycosyltransferase involved in cell wall biosynthesis
LWYWELSKVPLKWSYLFKFYDEIWATSTFIHQTLSRASVVPVQRIPFSLTVDTKITTPARERFGLKEGSCVFLFAFDYVSEFERKNPLAVVQAFRRAFDNEDDALLIINTINSNTDAENSRRLWDAARGARIFILDGHLTRPDYYALLVACNCYVSLHRSEGLGMIMAQAMYFGKPVIATGYSGNLDFMNKDNSLLVDFNLVELNRDYGPYYEKGNVWAEPDVDQASEFMRWIYEHPAEAKAMGETASRDVRKSMNPKVVGYEIRSMLQKIIEHKNAQCSPEQ